MPPSEAPWVFGVSQQPYLAGSLGIALTVVAFGRQTWDWTQRLNLWKACAIALIGWAGIVALLTQDYNPFIYFIF
jgi:hypothetical protein